MTNILYLTNKYSPRYNFSCSDVERSRNVHATFCTDFPLPFYFLWSLFLKKGTKKHNEMNSLRLTSTPLSNRRSATKSVEDVERRLLMQFNYLYYLLMQFGDFIFNNIPNNRIINTHVIVY